MSGGATKLYTAEVLGLATRLAGYPLDANAPRQGSARSASCGSSLSLSLMLDKAGHIAALGIAAQACAVGQASAAIFADAALGKSASDIAEAQAALSSWLAGDGEFPSWPGLESIAAARDYPGRHGAILLPWRAALDALCESPSAG